jgi:hypothetical protein
MVTKRLLVLANSTKYRGRCVAGREITDQGGSYRIGGWVRPVSSHGGGELSDVDRRLMNRGSDVRVLDFVDMPLLGPANDGCQPENWQICGPRTWTDVGPEYSRPPLEWLKQSPPDLWLESGGRTDRISHAQLTAKPPPASLYIIRPEGLRIRLYTQAYKPRRQALFRYRGVTYDLPITDPVIDEKCFGRIPKQGSPPLDFPLPCGDDCLICVSLTGDFQGHHYKIVATILENG